MTKFLALGDTHGNFRWLCSAAESILDQGITTIVQAGDFGYWEHTQHGIDFLDGVEDMLVSNGLELIWVDGNHENHTMLREKYIAAPGVERREGLVKIRESLWHCPRGNRFTVGNVKFLGMGGAWSIDKAYRTVGKSWWWEETITDEEVTYALRNTDPVDVVVSHDCPLGVDPMGPQTAGEKTRFPDTFANRQRLTEVVKVVKPKLVIHGHYHQRRTHPNVLIGDEVYTQIEGLGCDGDPLSAMVVEWHESEN